MYFRKNLFYEAWDAFRNIVHLSPIFSLGLSMVILIFVMRMLDLNREQRLVKEKIFSFLISLYIVTIVWGWIFVACFTFVASEGMSKQRIGLKESVQSDAHLTGRSGFILVGK
jgi:hypothetical protein